MVLQNGDFQNRGVQIDPMPDITIERVVVDLAAGDSYREPGGRDWLAMPRHLRLRPGKCVLIKTKQEIHLPRGVFGLLCSKGTVSAQGLWVGPLKIDPNFHGRLSLPILNASRHAIRIQQGQDLCALAVLLLERPLATDAQRPPLELPVRISGFPGWWDRHKEDVLRLSLNIVLTAIAAAASTYAVIAKSTK